MAGTPASGLSDLYHNDNKQFHYLINIRKGLQFYIANCKYCAKSGYYKDIRQEPCRKGV